jgi:cobalamin biosynthesis Mg chelatase CobN
MTAATALVLVLAGLLVVLLLARRSEGTLARAVAEYAVVALLALLLAFAPATREASAGMVAGVTSGSASLARLAASAWQHAFGQQVTEAPAAAEPARPAATARASRPTRTTRPPATLPTSVPEPTPAPTARSGVPLPVGVGLLAALALVGLVLLAWRIRRLDRRDPLDLGLARLPRGRGRRRRAA